MIKNKSLFLSFFCFLFIVSCEQDNNKTTAGIKNKNTVSNDKYEKGNISKITPKQKELITYLLEAPIPTEIQDLALKGHKIYQDENAELTKQRAQSLVNNVTGGGRDEKWVSATLGKNEDALVNQLKKLDAPKTWTVNDIHQTFNYLVKGAHNYEINNSASKEIIPHFIMVKGLSANYLQDSKKYGENSIVQIASQFNYLESVTENKSKVHNYPFDYTQGPQASIEALAAALHRYAAEESGKLPNALYKLLPENHDLYYKNGYLKLYKIENNKIMLNYLYNKFRKNIGDLTILPQWVICEATGLKQLQVFAAAPSYQNESQPKEDSVEGKIAELLVVTQYRAIAELAVIRKLELKKSKAHAGKSKYYKVNLHLTLVGQGAFNNPLSVLKAALKEVAKVVRGHSVTVFIHAYDDEGESKVEQAVDKQYFTLEKMSKEDFMKPLSWD